MQIWLSKLDYTQKFKLETSPTSRLFDFTIYLSFIILICTGFCVLVPEYTSRSNRIAIEKQEFIKHSNNSAFQFLMNSGMRRLRANNLVGAYSEFELAHNIYPEHEQLNQLLAETLSALCEDENEYCDELDIILNSSL